MNTDKTLALLLSCFSGERLMGLMDQALELQAAQTASGIDKMDLYRAASLTNLHVERVLFRCEGQLRRP